MVSAGVVKLAQMTGARIIPVSYDATGKLLLRSWDRFMVVLPLGRVHVAFGEPIEVPRGISPEHRRRCIEQLERTLHHLDGVCAAALAGRAAEMPEEAPLAPRRTAQEAEPSQEAGVR